MALARERRLRYNSPTCNYLAALLNARAALPSRRNGAILAKLDLFRFVPFRLNRLAAEVSAALASEYRQRYGLDIPEWRVIATLCFRDETYIARYFLI